MDAGRIERLTATDLINLYVETPTAPTRVGAIAILDGRTLVGDDGRLVIAALREAIGGRLHRVPRLRQIIHRAGPLAGRPLWVDDPAFIIERHIGQTRLPRGENLADLAMRLVTRPLDARHPLWRIWFVTGLPGVQVAMVFGMHHVVADGLSTVRLIGALTDTEADTQPPPIWQPRPPPSWTTLVRDNLRRLWAGVRALRTPDVAQWRSVAAFRRAPRTSLNHPVGARRRLDAVAFDLAAVKQAAHRHGAKVNDVVLALAGGGVRQLLLGRSEPVEGVRMHVSVAVSLRGDSSSGPGNRTGGIAVRLPLHEDPVLRLREIAQETRLAKGTQPPTAGNSLLIGLARLGLLRYFSRRQRMMNFVESNVAGPPGVLRLLGAPILDVLPIGTLAGNMALGFLALSYAGRLIIAVQADAENFPDLDVLLDAMRRDGDRLLAVREPDHAVAQTMSDSGPASLNHPVAGESR